MGIVQALIMGIVQGLTEFLPVSSSGHLSILNLFYGTSGDSGLDFSFFLHLATLIAAMVYFRRDIVGLITCWLPKNRHMVEYRKMFKFLIVACLVTGPIGLALDDRLGALASSTLALGLSYLFTTVMLSLTEYLTTKSAHNEIDSLSTPKSAFIGLAQGIAVIPGISRAGATIAGGMVAGLSKQEATRFSFLVGLPIILLGALKDGVGLMQGTIVLPSVTICAVGFAASAVTGYLAIAWMIRYVEHIKLYWFAAYTAVLGIALISFSLMGGI